MNIIIHLIILFIFVFLLLVLNIPHLTEDQRLKQKLYIFCGVFLFEMIIGIFSAIFKKQIVNINRILKYSLQSALLAAIGYSVAKDIHWSDKIKSQDPRVHKLLTTLVIVMFVAFGYLFDAMLNRLTPTVNDCINTIYPQN